MQELYKKIDESWEKLYPELSVATGGERGWKAAAARARKESFVLEKLLKEFRKVSCAEANG